MVKIIFKIYFFRITSPDVIPSSDVQFHPLRIDVDLSKFVLVDREFFGLSIISLPVDNVFCRDNLIGECCGSRVNCLGSEITVTIIAI